MHHGCKKIVVKKLPAKSLQLLGKLEKSRRSITPVRVVKKIHAAPTVFTNDQNATKMRKKIVRLPKNSDKKSSRVINNLSLSPSTKFDG